VTSRFQFSSLYFSVRRHAESRYCQPHPRDGRMTQGLTIVALQHLDDLLQSYLPSFSTVDIRSQIFNRLVPLREQRLQSSDLNEKRLSDLGSELDIVATMRGIVTIPTILRSGSWIEVLRVMEEIGLGSSFGYGVGGG
jgi:hypothetical protein